MEAPAWVQAIGMVALLVVLVGLVAILVRERRKSSRPLREHHRAALESLPAGYRLERPPYFWLLPPAFLFVAFLAGYLSSLWFLLVAVPLVALLMYRPRQFLVGVLREVRGLPEPERASRLEALKVVYGRNDVERLWERTA